MVNEILKQENSNSLKKEDGLYPTYNAKNNFLKSPQNTLYNLYFVFYSNTLL